jgi:DNA-binding NarL/FixJ family response regulator
MMGWDDPIRILLATANERISNKLEKVLTSASDVEVIGIATTPLEVLKAAGQKPFDVLISDLDLTATPGITVRSTTEVLGREVQLVEICGSSGSSISVLQIAVAVFHERPFSRNDFLATIRTARGE